MEERAPQPDTERLVRQFIEMVQIDSESGEEAGMMQYLLEAFHAVGAAAELDSYGNLLARLPAKGAREGAAPLLLSCHADTVKPGRNIRPVIEGGVIRSGGDTILGADDKAGLAEMLEALRIAPIRPPVEIAVSRQEEVGLLGVKNMDFSRITARKGFLLDNDTLDSIVTGGPSYFTLDVTFHGRAAHAGMEPEKGINAIVAAAKAISALRLGRLDARTTANVGVIQGGLVRNGVPDSCTFLAECRSLDHPTAAALAEEMAAIIRREGEAAGARVDLEVRCMCEAVNIAEDAPTVLTALRALSTVGVNASTTLITGFTDASIYNNKGIECAVIGIGARDEHATTEHIHISDMEAATRAVVEILRLSALE